MTAPLPHASAVDLPAPFGTVLSAMVTPFTADGVLDLDAAQRLAAHLVDRGHDGLVLSGTTGESPTTSNREKSQLIAAVVEAVGDRARIVAGVGTYDTAHSLELSRQAAAAGAHGLLVVSPYYSKPPQAGILAHLVAVADSGDLPVMLYDIPGRCGVKLAEDTIARAAEHRHIVALKDASGDLAAGARTMARTDLAYYSGDDHLNLPWLALGAVGIVSVVAQVAGPQFRALVDAMARSDLMAARRAQQDVLPLVDAMMNHTQGAIMAKAALSWQGILPSPAVRAPLIEASPEELSLLVPLIAKSPANSAPMEARA